MLPSSAVLQAISHHVARDWLMKDKSESAKPSKTNRILMHGVMHSNGFGHLVEINNGFQGGSHFVSGRQIMDLWDRICSALQVRCVLFSLFSLRNSFGKFIDVLENLKKGELDRCCDEGGNGAEISPWYCLR